MKIGVNTLLWTAGFGPEHFPLLDRIRSWGFDGVEIARFDFNGFPVQDVKRAARDAGLDITFCSALTGTMSLVSDDAGIRLAASDFIKRGVEVAAELGSPVFIGPFCAPVGQLLGRRRTADEWKRAVEGLSALAAHLDSHNVTIALEPLNRFETYFLNTAADTASLLNEVHHPRIGALLDTFHANIEEKTVSDAAAALGGHIAHVHTCENDRGIPGSGHVDWNGLFHALRKANYNRWLVIESFGFAIAEIAAAACIWRDLASSPEAIAIEGYKFLSGLIKA